MRLIRPLTPLSLRQRPWMRSSPPSLRSLLSTKSGASCSSEPFRLVHRLPARPLRDRLGHYSLGSLLSDLNYPRRRREHRCARPQRRKRSQVLRTRLASDCAEPVKTLFPKAAKAFCSTNEVQGFVDSTCSGAVAHEHSLAQTETSAVLSQAAAAKSNIHCSGLGVWGAVKHPSSVAFKLSRFCSFLMVSGTSLFSAPAPISGGTAPLVLHFATFCHILPLSPHLLQTPTTGPKTDTLTGELGVEVSWCPEAATCQKLLVDVWTGRMPVTRMLLEVLCSRHQGGFHNYW